jgi:hypothetical protein
MSIEQHASPDGDDVIVDNAYRDEDAALIAAARTDVPTLVAEVRRLQRHSAALKKLLALNSVRVEPRNAGDVEAAATLQAALRSEDMIDDVLEMYVQSVIKMK